LFKKISFKKHISFK